MIKGKKFKNDMKFDKIAKIIRNLINIKLK